MDDLDIALSVCLDDEKSSEDVNNRLEESIMFKNRETEGAFQILVRRHLQCNDEKFRQYFLTKSINCSSFSPAHITFPLIVLSVYAHRYTRKRRTTVYHRYDGRHATDSTAI
ncbi:unnamed protein product [Phaedon cochleariae]|uniref:Uncharacterized protein n=1 Tax=Phaedon cochleariae TaxID=80249 RepID=A0A9P0DDX6_PHACE|nr:unnamed protein product [Phaedon cochleariae]